MAAGDIAEYSWVAEGGQIKFDLHPTWRRPVRRLRPGTWCNRDGADVTVTLQLRGAYSEIIRSE